MTNFVRNGVTYTIVYIDPSIATAGDGSTAATALKNFPSSLANNICYLVRRCDGTVSANWATSQSSVTNIMVIGMPKPTDEFYDLIDSDTKTAWDADTGDYGIVTKSSSNYPIMTTAKQVLFDKIYFNKTYNGMHYLFDVGSSNNIANTFTLTNCKFGTIDCPLDNDAWIASNEPTSTQLKYLYCSNSIYSNNVLIKGNIINIAAYNYNGTNPLFGLYNTINCNILENTVRSIVSNDETYITNCNIFRFSSCKNYIKVLRNTIKYLIKPNTTKLGLQGLLYFGQSYISNLLIENIDISSAPMNGGSVNTGTSTSTEQFLIYITCASNYTSIKNINADFNTNAGAKLSLSEVLYYRPDSTKYKKQMEIDNININLCEDLTASVTSNRNVNKNALSIIGSGVGSNNIIANNINVIAPHTNALKLKDCGAININNVKGDILCGTGESGSACAAVININSLESLYHDTKCIKINNGNQYYTQLLLHIGTLNVVNNTATPTIPQIDYQTPNLIKSTVFVDNSNALLYTDADWSLKADYSTDADTAIICPNCVVSGQYYSMMSAGSVKSSSAYRTGSSNTASLRFNRTNNSSDSVCSIGQAPFKGIMITPQSAGDHVLKIYLATTGSHDVPTFFSNFVVTSYAKENENVHIRTSNSNGNIKEDTSTWNSISDYTAYVVELPIHCYDTSPIEVKIDDLYYKSGFNVYLDTDIVLE